MNLIFEKKTESHFRKKTEIKQNKTESNLKK